jgi:peptidoglycan/LPS O-acetylase OafA/YrhL
MAQTPRAEPARIASLDGLRGVSILLVLAAHATTQAMRHGFDAKGAWLMGDLGCTGVDVFFGISGFVITALLLREWQATEAVDLRAFYLRRAFRILPALWVFLLSITLVWQMSHADLAKALLFVTNLSPTGTWRLDHTWSLSVEEQFYLAWPLTMAVLGPRRALRLAWVAVAALPVVRVAVHALWVAPRGVVWHVLHLRFDTILLGCVVAVLRASCPEHRLLRVLSRPGVAAASVAFLTVGSPVLWSRLGEYYDLTVGASCGAFAVASIVLYAIEDAGSLLGRVLNSAPLVHVGTISYSLYLWQQPFFAPELQGPLARWPVALAAAFVLAEASYRLVEVPMLRLRVRLTSRRRPVPATPRMAVPAGAPAVVPPTH